MNTELYEAQNAIKYLTNKVTGFTPELEKINERVESAVKS